MARAGAGSTSSASTRHASGDSTAAADDGEMLAQENGKMRAKSRPIVVAVVVTDATDAAATTAGVPRGLSHAPDTREVIGGHHRRTTHITMVVTSPGPEPRPPSATLLQFGAFGTESQRGCVDPARAAPQRHTTRDHSQHRHSRTPHGSTHSSLRRRTTWVLQRVPAFTNYPTSTV